MPDVLAALATVVEMAKRLREISQKIKDAETKNLIADLNLSLADLKMQLAEVQEENRRLHSELASIREAKISRNRLERRGALYHLRDPQAGEDSGPYCTRCFDVEQKLVLVAKLAGAFAAIGKFKCPNCAAVYQ